MYASQNDPWDAVILFRCVSWGSMGMVWIESFSLRHPVLVGMVALAASSDL